MKYAVLIQLMHGLSINKVDESWHIIKEENGIVYKWRLKKDRYQLLSGEYDDKEQAKNDARKLLVSSFYNYCFKLQTESYAGSIGMIFRDLYQEFVYERNHYCSHAPIAVYEIESLSQIENMLLLSGSIYLKTDYIAFFDFKDLFSDRYFNYSDESNHYLYVLNLAMNTMDFGFSMTLLCGILERISTGGNKDDTVIKEIDRLKSLIDRTKLSNNDYGQLINYLESGKKMSANQKCLITIKKYAENFNMGGYSSIEIFKDAYSVRSSYSHGNEVDYKEPSCYMKELMLYIINEYFKDKQQKK